MGEQHVRGVRLRIVVVVVVVVTVVVSAAAVKRQQWGALGPFARVRSCYSHCCTPSRMCRMTGITASSLNVITIVHVLLLLSHVGWYLPASLDNACLSFCSECDAPQGVVVVFRNSTSSVPLERLRDRGARTRLLLSDFLGATTVRVRSTVVLCLHTSRKVTYCAGISRPNRSVNLAE